ncbi:MAG: hypothetical protein HY895_17660 [Deltaproteobacteria bacterium]|nr:hypothetical protein [Deltaproteobacteria bacterium]
MIAVCPKNECHQRYRIQPGMIGKIAKCKKCNNPFKIEELIFSPEPLELKPIHNGFIEQTTKHYGNHRLEPEASLPSSGTASLRAPLTQSSKKTFYKASPLLVIAVLGIAALLFIGNNHIISGRDKGLSIVRRDSFGLSEFFVNADRITAMQPVSANAQFPLSFKVLQREGVIKADEASKRRINDEEKKEIDKAVRDAQKEIDRIMQGAEKSFK